MVRAHDGGALCAVAGRMYDGHMPGLVVVDGDDTLWETEQLYDTARSEARRIVEAAGIDGARWEALERAIDVENVERLGLSAERFPTSCVEAYWRLAGHPKKKVAEALRTAAAAVFRAEATLYPDSVKALSALARNYRLVLFTKGDDEVQLRRIAQSGLADYFDEIIVTDSKDAASFRRIRNAHARRDNTCWSIGNSLRSDILPAIEAGYSAVWVDRHVWEYEHAEHATAKPNGAYEATSLSEAVEIVEGALRKGVSKV